MRRNPEKERTLDEIEASGFVRLAVEAPKFVPLSYDTLARYAREGRLRTFHRPRACELTHLREQYKAGFPKLDNAEAAA